MYVAKLLPKANWLMKLTTLPSYIFVPVDVVTEKRNEPGRLFVVSLLLTAVANS
ncbi:MAG: hypothetical protein MZU97_04510 [Bacillus subtilis]|nr:hypothetical protein [Bacillus subtilis]